jgi:anthranilate phosphoribosyltransferase
MNKINSNTNLNNIKWANKKIFAGHSLTAAECKQIVDMIVNKNISEIEITTLLTLLAYKGESSQEILGFAQGMREKTIPLNKLFDEPIIDTCGTGGSNLDTFNVSTLSAIVVAAAGVKVGKHGNRFVTSSCGSADLLEALGINLELPLEKITLCLKEIGITFFFAPKFHPAMKYISNIRKNMGIRTIFNSLGPLLNPLQADFQIMGIFHSQTEKIAKVLQSLNTTRGMVVHGLEGIDEISLCGDSKITEFDQENLKTYIFNPKDLGFSLVDIAFLKGGGVADNKKIALQILDPKEKENNIIVIKEWVILNAGAALKVAGVVKELGDACQQARKILHDGIAKQKLNDWVEFAKY